jgi:hypothetical protein
VLAAKVIDLQSVPIWSLWIFGLVGIAMLLGVVVRILPNRLRRRYLAFALLGFALFSARAAFSRDARTVLFFAGVGGIASLAILSMGQMPADMPPATDPACRLHPQYAAVARRGRIAGTAFIALATGLGTLSLIFVRGL